MNNRTTTVAVRLDLAELITQLRNLADTLETTQKPKQQLVDENTPTVKFDDPFGIRSGYTLADLGLDASEVPECKHEAWDVHPNGITRHCSDCRAPLHDLEGDRLAAGKLSDEALAALRRKLSGQPEPSHFTDGTKPARNPHTIDLPDGLDPAEAQHMLEVIADAQSGRTDPVLFAAKPRNLLFIPKLFIPKPRNLAETLAGENAAASRDLDPQPLRCPQCDDPWHPRAICPTCGCDHRRADHGADPR